MATLDQAFAQALAHYRTGQAAEAQAICAAILGEAPGQPDTLHLLAVLACEAGQHDAALAHVDRAIAGHDGSASFHLTRGMVLRALGQLDQAIASYERVLTLEPNLAEAHANLCNALRERGQFDRALQAGRRAVELRPDLFAGHLNLAHVLQARDQIDQALIHYRQATTLAPEHAGAWYGFGRALQRKRCIAEALQAVQQAAALDPADATLALYVAELQREQGGRGVQDAVVTLRTLLERQPGHDAALRKLACTLNYDPASPGSAIFAAHRRWGQRYDYLSLAAGHDNQPHANRRIRLGYVSPDFRRHAVAHFLEPVLAHHDPDRVEVFCYAEVAAPDAVTERLRRHVPHWYETVGMRDDQLAQTIRRDRIDLLVDLAGHTAGNRLLALARKPAPLQVTWLGYPATTGLEAFDYRLSDAVASPPDEPTQHIETVVRLACGASCYAPPADAPPVQPRNSGESAAGVTFGSLSNPVKLNDAVLDLWCRVVRSVSGSRLMIVREPLRGQARDVFLTALYQRGLEPQQVVLRDTFAEVRQPIEHYQEIDIALDPFPYSGHTTVCEALWMGVPTVTLRGATLAGRMAASVLTQVGLTQHIAGSADQYVKIAARLARDRHALAELRSTLRDRVSRSGLCDAAAFTRQLEQTYASLWRRWCQNRAAA